MKSIRVPLSALRPGEASNPRKTGKDEGLSELTASIKAHGQQTPINVRPVLEGGEEVYEIIDGRRRFAVLTKLYGKDAAKHQVPVCVFDIDEAEARERALVANVQRVNLHPVDRYEAFQALIDDGMTPEAVAKRFGMKAKEVGRALQVAKLAPELRDEWRKGKLDADQAAALSSTPDQDLQRRIWKEASKSKHNTYGRQPEQLRREIRRASEGVLASESVALFVGLDAYVAAGGRVREDLFSDETTLLDPAILHRLSLEKMEAKAAELVAEGWSWALPEPKLPVLSWRLKDVDVLPFATPAEKSALGGKAQTAWEAAQTILARIEADPKARAVSGVVVSFNGDGEFELDTLKVLPVEAEAPPAAETAESYDEADEPDEAGPEPAVADDEPVRVNYALRERISEMMTVALSEALARSPIVALGVLFASLEHSLKHHAAATPLRVSTSDAWDGLNAGREYCGTWAKTFAQCSAGVDLKVVAKVVARLIDVRMVKVDYRRGADWQAQRNDMVEAIATALPGDLVRESIDKAFVAETYFKGVNADECKAALLEMGWRAKLPSKKAELVTVCSNQAALHGWLPPELRTAHYLGPRPAPAQAAE